MQPPIKIGRGFHINDVYRQTRACFTPESCSPQLLTSQQTGGKSTNVAIHYLTTEREYNTFTSGGLSGEVSFLNLFALGGKKLSSYNTTETEEREYIIFSATVDFGTYTYDSDPIMLPEAKTLLEQKNYADFVKFFGTHYINGVRKSSRILVILQSENSSNTWENSLETDIHAKIPLPEQTTLSFSNPDNQTVNAKLNNTKFSVLIKADGPTLNEEDIKIQVQDILDNSYEENKAEKISAIIGSASKNISDPNQAIITHYYYAPFDLFGLDGVYWDEKKQQQLIRINEAVIQATTNLEEVKSVISPTFRTEIENILTEAEYTAENIKKVLWKFDLIKHRFNPLREQAEEDLRTLENMYLACADVSCVSTDSCCNTGSLNEITDKDYIQQINTIFQPVFQEIHSINTEASKPECEKNQLGSITIKNLSTNPYYLYQGDNLLKTISGNSEVTYNVKAGTYYFTAKQKSGYIVYPTVNERKAIISKPCQTVTLTVGYKD